MIKIIPLFRQNGHRYRLHTTIPFYCNYIKRFIHNNDNNTTTIKPVSSSLSSSSSSSLNQSVNSTTTTTASTVVNDVTISAATSSSDQTVLKDPSSTTTATTTTTSSDHVSLNIDGTSTRNIKRPLFPWRHDIVPIPRLVEGTKEYNDIKKGTNFLSKNVINSSFYSRNTCNMFFDVPILTCIFSFGIWKQNLADYAAYAFIQSVAGIVSNTYQVPLSNVTSHVNDNDMFSSILDTSNTDNNTNDDDDDDNSSSTVPVVHFQYPVTSSTTNTDNSNNSTTSSTDPATIMNQEFHSEIMNIVNQLLDNNKDLKDEIEKNSKVNEQNIHNNDAKTSQSQSTLGTTDDTINVSSNLSTSETGRNDKSNIDPSANTPDSTNTNTIQCNPVMQKDDSSTTCTSNVPPATPATNDNENNTSRPTTQKHHPAFQDPFISKSFNNNNNNVNSTIEQTSSPKAMSSVPKKESDTSDMFCSNISQMMIEPLRKLYKSAHESGRDQLQIKLHMKVIDAKLISLIVPGMTRDEAPENIKLFHSDRKALIDQFMFKFMPGQDFQSNIEIQIWVTCLESFQVIDRETGIVLQGSNDGLPQEVTHIVRLETTSTVEWDPIWMSRRSTNTNWVVTDIDDMLGHKTWYNTN